MGQTKDIEMSFLNGFLSHQLTFKPKTFDAAIAGAVNNATTGVAAGSHEVPVDGISADDSTAIMDALANNKLVYLKNSAAGTADTQAYKVINAVKTADAITKLWVYPKTQKAWADDDAISIGGDIEIDFGVIGEDGVKINLTVESQEVLDEVGAVYKKIQKVKKGKVTFPILHLTVENFLLTMPNSYYVVKDGNVAYKYGIKKGIFTAQKGVLKCVDRANPTDKGKTITFKEVVSGIESIDFNINEKDTTVSIPLTFDISSDELIEIGDELATYSA